MSASSSILRLLAAAFAIALLSGIAAGCKSAKPTTSSLEDEISTTPKLSEENQAMARGFLSAVEIHGQPLVTVQETLESVFIGAGLALLKRDSDEVTFERPATRKERGAYGTWFGGDARVRMRVEIFQQSRGVIFLRCRGHIARDAGTNAEDQQPLARRHVRDYEGLLDEVSARLN
ncbi:MAG: hypothetical protein AB7O66_10150 [Limisphaerales bacterium]